jgi:hypothetical protein
MAHLAEAYEVYFAMTNRQTIRLEQIASRLKGAEQKAVLEIVAELRKGVGLLREQVDLVAEWG